MALRVPAEQVAACLVPLNPLFQPHLRRKANARLKHEMLDLPDKLVNVLPNDRLCAELCIRPPVFAIRLLGAIDVRTSGF
jgi:hypothetical protein